MTFSKVKPTGWAFGEVLTSAQMNTLDTDHANSVDGAAGGAYTLTALLSLQRSHATEYIFQVTNTGAGPALLAVGAGSSPALVAQGDVAALLTGQVAMDSSGVGAHQLIGATEIQDGSTFKMKGATEWPRCDSRTLTYAQPLHPAASNTSTRFVIDEAIMALDQSDVTSAGAWIIPVLNRPTKASGTITAIMSVDGNGAGTGHGALPATMPKIQILWVNADNSLSSSSIGTDSSADVTAYHAVHNVLTSTGALTMTGAEAIYVKITGETGANSAANALRIYRCWLTFPVTEIAP